LRQLLSIGLACAAVGLLAGCGGTTTVTVTQTVTQTVAAPTPAVPACSAADLGGSFAVVRGSAGAGQISYLLTLTNKSGSPCFVAGLPSVQLLDAQGGTLPTSVTAAQPGQATAAKVVLQPAASAGSAARFSPDVPGPGEGQANQPCEPVAHQLQVSPNGGGTLVVPVTPPTSVCESGSLRMTVFTTA
jgi:hypothetical protein